MSTAVPDALAPPPGNPRFPLVDSLRAIAALSVLASHVLLVGLGARVPGIFGALGSGVAIFFVISGLLLYRPYVAARLDGRRGPPLRTYARRRALRILPAYWLALTVLSIYPGVAGVPGPHSWVFYALLQNWSSDLATQGLPQAWSLSVEATWYVLLPVIGIVLWRLMVARGGRGSVRAEVLALAALLAVRLGYEPLRSPAWDTAFYYLDWFLAGMALALLSAALSRAHVPDRPLRAARLAALIARHPDLCWLAALAVYCTFAFRLAHHPPTFVNHLEQGAFATLVVVPAVLVGEGGGISRRLLRSRLLAWLGLISYGIYLWHVPIVLRLGSAESAANLHSGRVLLLGAGSLLLTTGCASISYYLLERPLLRFKRRRGERRRAAYVTR